MIGVSLGPGTARGERGGGGGGGGGEGTPVTFDVVLASVSSGVCAGIALDLKPCGGGGGGAFLDLNSISDIDVDFASNSCLRFETSVFSAVSSLSRLARLSTVRLAMSWASMSETLSSCLV
jgi:hypothetical protein